MANKPLQFVLTERKLTVGKHAGEVVQIAVPTGRHRVDFRNFCERVSQSTTFNEQEVSAILNYAIKIAREIVANGDMGTFTPSFKSKAVSKGEQFNTNVHIEKPVVQFNPSRKYFTLTDVSYERVKAPEKKKK